MEIVFPTTTAPGVNPTESGGRLINAYAEAAPVGSRGKVLYRRVPGLAKAFSTANTDARGALLVGSVLYIVSGDKAYSVTKAGAVYTVTALSGTVPGTGPVTMARNMNATPQILIEHSDGMSQINSGAASVSDFSDPDLPAINSISYLGGYFITTAANGQANASGINAVTFSSLDRTTAEAQPDGLVRGIAYGGELYLFGTASLEIYGNAGNPTGFPFSRGPVLNVGLFGKWAVAGWEPEFSGTLYFVARDNTVRRMNGYTPEIISNPDLQRLIGAVVDPATLEMSVFVAAGHQYVVLTSPDWTWVYSNGEWHERKSYGAERWRGRFGIKAFDEWLTFDRASGQVYRIDPTVKREGDDPLVWEVRSTQAHRFPSPFIVIRANFDFVTGVGTSIGIDPIETDPVVLISWSDDGGRTFGNELTRKLGMQGVDVAVEVWRCGIAGGKIKKGRQWRLRISDPVEVALLGGAMDAEALAA